MNENEMDYWRTPFKVLEVLFDNHALTSQRIETAITRSVMIISISNIELSDEQCRTIMRDLQAVITELESVVYDSYDYETHSGDNFITFTACLL